MHALNLTGNFLRVNFVKAKSLEEKIHIHAYLRVQPSAYAEMLLHPCLRFE
jgi:hypothetical protein